MTEHNFARLMLSKNEIKFLNALKQKKFRNEHGLFIAEGEKIINDLLKSTINIRQVYATSEFIQTLPPSNTIEYIEIKSNELERISSLTTANSALAVCEIPNHQLNIDSLKEQLTLVLDDIKDPGNLGTIIRIADWFGISTIICSEETADAFNPKVVQATMGSIARIKIHYVQLTDFFQKQKESINLPVYGALLEGENVFSKKLSTNGFVVIGNESRGISIEIQQQLTDKITIPSFSNAQKHGEAESLNAAIATAVICSEFRRHL